MVLPRGEQAQNFEKPIATARWANEEEVKKYRYKPGDIFLGYIETYPEQALPLVAQLNELEAQIKQTYQAPEHYDFLYEQRRRMANLRTRLRTKHFPIGFNDDRHAQTAAGSRSGKGVSTLIPNLLRYPGSACVIDPKAELAKITASRRGKGSKHCDGMGQKVQVLHPFNRKGEIPDELLGSFNPLDLCTADNPDATDNASSIAEACVVKADSKDAHWDDSAKSLIRACSIFVAQSETEQGERHLPRVLELLRKGAKDRYDETEDEDDGEGVPDYMGSLFHEMSHFDDEDGVVSGVATMMLSASENERGSILSTARRNLEFLEKRKMKRVLSKTTFDLDQLKTDPDGMTIYLCLPPARMADCSRWLRLMLSLILERVYETRLMTEDGDFAADDETATGYPILFLIEEMPVLGHMQLIETAAGFSAGYGAKFWYVIQDLNQIKHHYKETWETLGGNAGVLQAFGNSDNTTTEYFSKKLGECQTLQTTRTRTIANSNTANLPSEFMKTQAISGQSGQGIFGKGLGVAVGMEDQVTHSESSTETFADAPQILHSPLIRSDEFERTFSREAGTQCIMIKGERPIACMRETYYNSPDFLGLFDPDRAPYRTKEEALADAARIREDRAAIARQAQEDAAQYIADITAALDQAKA